MGIRIDLSNCEQAVWKLHQTEGMSFSQIAAELNLSIREVKRDFCSAKQVEQDNQFLCAYEDAYRQEMTVSIEYDDLMLVREALMMLQAIAEQTPDELIDGLGAMPYDAASVRAGEMLQVINRMKATAELRLYPNRSAEEAEPQSQQIV